MPSLCGELIHVSIHPPRVGWDTGWDGVPWLTINFNPPTPCGVGPVWVPKPQAAEKFQSTHPVWGGTVIPIHTGLIQGISIHPPRVGWDETGNALGLSGSAFQSTHPVWGGTLPCHNPCCTRQFQSTHPVWGGTGQAAATFDAPPISIHPPRVGWDQKRCSR